jgi:hypothetical protein
MPPKTIIEGVAVRVSGAEWKGLVTTPGVDFGAADVGGGFLTA